MVTRKTIIEPIEGYDYLENVSLQRFCTKKMYRVVVFTQADDFQTHHLGLLASEGNKHADVSNAHFILYQDVRKIIMDPYKRDIPLPKDLLETYKKILTDIEVPNMLPQHLLPHCVKLKIIMLMYDLYKKEVEKMYRRKALEEELRHLCDQKDAKGKKGDKKHKDEKKSVKDKKSKSEKENKSVKSGKGDKTKDKNGPKEIDDYTTIKIEPNEEILDDNMYDQELIFVLAGFIDYRMVSSLIKILHVPIMACVELNPSHEIMDETCAGGLDRAELFWCKIKKYIFGNTRLPSFENTVLMEFTSNENAREMYKELLGLLKRFFEVKLLHLRYLRSMKVYDVEETNSFIPVRCMKVYRNVMDLVCPELRTVPMILYGVLEEVLDRLFDENSKKYGCLGNKVKKTSQHVYSPNVNIILDKMSSENIICTYPFSIDAFFEHKKRKKEEQKVKGNKKTYRVEKYDLLGNIIQSYGQTAALYDEATKNMLKVFMKGYLWKNIKTSNTNENPHLHDKVQEPKLEKPDNQYQLDHFMYLLMFSCLQHLNPALEETITKNAINKNLQLYKPSEEYRELNWTKFEDRTESQMNMFKYDKVENVYQPTTINYHWIEKLSSEVMMQKIFKASTNYSHMDKFYCEENECLLVQFHDYLDENGLATNKSFGCIKTPICFRDFCRYISVFDGDWLMENQPSEYFDNTSRSEIELCPGGKLILENKIYEEYSHLISDGFTSTTNEPKINFQECLDEILNYPNANDIYESLYKNPSEDKKDFVGFNLGSSLMALTGGVQVFKSHDDIHIEVDTTRFIDDEHRCSFIISSRGISLYIYCSERIVYEDYSYHYRLSDNTIITFTLKSKHDNYNTLQEAPMYNEYYDIQLEESIKSTLTETYGVENIEHHEDEVYINAVNNEYLQEKLNNNEVHTEYENIESKVKIHEQNDPKFLTNLKQALDEDRPIFKVDKNYKYLKPLHKNSKIPLSSVLHRVLEKPIVKSRLKQKYKRRFKSEYAHAIKNRQNISFFVTMPNGLRITQCLHGKSGVKIKQEFVDKGHQVKNLDLEDYRIFSKTGHVLVKFKDGSLNIYNHLGTMICYEKPLLEEGKIGESSVTKPCICLNMDSYRKKLQRLFKEEFNKQNTHKISRRHLMSGDKKKFMKNQVKDLENLTIPYYKTTVINSQGHVSTYENDVLKQHQKFYAHKETDYVLNTVSQERTDGWKCLLFENGEIHVKFPDNSKIICWFIIDERKEDSFVFISIGFKFEHPYYNTIEFDPLGTLSIPLNSKTTLRKLPNNNFELKSSQLNFSMGPENIKFQKSCQSCSGLTMGKVTLTSFVNNRWLPLERLLKFTDSYDKIFYWTVNGKCSHNSCFIKSSLNQYGCHHYSKMDYKKLFLINKDFGGQMFWTNYMLNSKVKKYEDQENCEVLYYESALNKEVLISDFRQKFYTDFVDYYFNTDVLKEQFCLNAYKKQIDQELTYETFLQIRQILNEETLLFLCKDLAKHMKENPSFLKLLSILNTMLEDAENYDPDIFAPNINKQIQVSIPKCNCRKTFITMTAKNKLCRDQINKYKEMCRDLKVSKYFESEYYTMFMKKINKM